MQMKSNIVIIQSYRGETAIEIRSAKVNALTTTKSSVRIAFSFSSIGEGRNYSFIWYRESYVTVLSSYVRYWTLLFDIGYLTSYYYFLAIWNNNYFGFNNKLKLIGILQNRSNLVDENETLEFMIAFLTQLLKENRNM